MNDRRDQAIAAYVAGEPIKTILLRFEISNDTLSRWCRAEGIPPRRPVHRKRVQRERYAAEPQTPLARRVRRVYEADPNAGTAVWAQQSGASEGYVSRLVGHWRAGEEK